MTYVYETPDGARHDLDFPFGTAPPTFKIGRKTARLVPCCGTFQRVSSKSGRIAAKWPIKSESMGVHSSQVKDCREWSKKQGCPTDYTPDGRPILTSEHHRNRFCKMAGFANLSRK